MTTMENKSNTIFMVTVDLYDETRDGGEHYTIPCATIEVAKEVLKKVVEDKKQDFENWDDFECGVNTDTKFECHDNFSATTLCVEIEEKKLLAPGDDITNDIWY